MDVKQYISSGEAARRLGVSHNATYWWLRRGKLKGISTAVGWLIDPDDVEALRREREAHPPQKGRPPKAGSRG